MLELKNVSITLKNGGRNLADDLSFTLNKGDKTVIIGEEGNGKSTLLKFIYDRSTIEDYCDCKGIVRVFGKMAYLPQMLPIDEYNKTLYEYFCDTEYYMHADALSKIGLDMDFILSEQTLGTLSGGEKVKVQLARLLMEDPDILLLDEPTNDLDIETLEWLEDFIIKSKLSILYISHDETLIERTATAILHMEQIDHKHKCRISLVRCSYRDYLYNRRLTFDHQQTVAQKQRDDYNKQKERWLRIYNSVQSRQNSVSRSNPSGGRLLKKKMHSVLSMGKRFERQKENFLDFPDEEEAILTKFDESITLPAGKTILDIDIGKLVIDEKTLAKDIRLFVRGAEHIGITGKNGAGKTTLLKIIWQQLSDRRDICAAYMPQNYIDVLDYSKTPIEHLAENFTKDEVTKARMYMGSMKFTRDEMASKIGTLSGGQRAKLLFLDMVLNNANVLVLDEPTRNFSPLSGPVVRNALYSFGGAIISISHDRKYLEEVCDKVYYLDEDGLYLCIEE